MNTRRWNRKLLVILGPTASGKSSLAINVALQVGGEVVNCDAMQMIRYLDIGTAKPKPEQKRLIPHHLFDTVDPDEFYSAGAYMKEARSVCREISERAMVPILVGGTGLYLRVFLQGIFEGPERSLEIRSRLKRIGERKGSSYLHSLLTRKDAIAASRIEANDLTRTIRALEVALLTGESITELQKRRKALQGFRVLKVGLELPREVLYDRINRRVESMFAEGLLEEVRSLLDRGYSPSSKGFEAFGYRYAVALLRQEMTRDQAIDLTQRDTRRYAKRQMTWFRKEEDVIWHSGPGENEALASELVKLLEGLGG